MSRLDSTDAKLHWDLSRYAYRDEAPAREAVERKGLEWGRAFSGASTQGFSCTDGNRTLLAFRGSEDNPIDWVRNAEFGPVSGELGGHVHSGHRRALSEVWSEIEPVVTTADLPVSTTGHSLGAALATLAAARIVESGHPVEVVHTFGQPRIGKRDFRSAYDAQLGDVTFRFVNHIDLVTRVPFLLQGYRHVGRRMYFDASGNFISDATAAAIARDDLAYRIRHLGRIRAIGIGPHMVQAYSARMAGI